MHKYKLSTAGQYPNLISNKWPNFPTQISIELRSYRHSLCPGHHSIVVKTHKHKINASYRGLSDLCTRSDSIAFWGIYSRQHDAPKRNNPNDKQVK